MKYSKKLVQVLAFTGWSQDHLADLLGVSNNTFNSWVNGNSLPHQRNAGLIDEIYDKIVAPYICELERKADEVEKEILRQKIVDLPKDNVCPVD